MKQCSSIEQNLPEKSAIFFRFWIVRFLQKMRNINRYFKDSQLTKENKLPRMLFRENDVVLYSVQSCHINSQHRKNYQEMLIGADMIELQ